MDDSSSNPHGLLDNVAVALSSLCLLHCLTLPLAIALLPFLGSLDASHFHAQILVVVLPVSIIALTLGYRRHCSITIVAWGVVGILVLVIGSTVAHQHYGIVADRSLTIGGGLILAVAHYFNNRFSRHRVRQA